MPAKRVTICPVGLADKLNEYEKMLTYPKYGKWRARQILEQVDPQDLSEPEKLWIRLLVWSGDPGRRVKEFILEDLKRDASKFGPAEKQFIKFFIRVIQKKPAYADNVIQMFD
jgi:hypothetical protein